MGGGRRARRRRWAPVLAVLLVAAACSDDDGPTVAEPSGPVVTEGATTTTTGEMRPVPTVPPSTLPGQTGGDGTEPGVVDASPTIAPPPVDPDAPTTSVVAPTTELVGDPQPNPDTTSAPPPPPPSAPGDPDACERLAQFDVVGVIADTAAVNTSGVSVAAEICRYAAGSFVAEVHYLSVAEVRDWFTRDGIEPVGEVASDAVGFSSYVPPGAAPAVGYTIAVEGGDRGVVVAVTGTDDARRVAGQVAVYAAQAA